MREVAVAVEDVDQLPAALLKRDRSVADCKDQIVFDIVITADRAVRDMQNIILGIIDDEIIAVTVRVLNDTAVVRPRHIERNCVVAFAADERSVFAVIFDEIVTGSAVHRHIFILPRVLDEIVAVAAVEDRAMAV